MDGPLQDSPPREPQPPSEPREARQPGPRARRRGVFFDAGGTLLRVQPSVGHVYAAAVRQRGFDVSPQDIERSFRLAWSRSQVRRREAGYVTSDAILREEWRRIVSDAFEGLVPSAVAVDAFEFLYDHFSRPEPWTLAEGVLETLSALRAEGYLLGILSNWDSRLTSLLEELGLRAAFDHLVISHAVGVEKPHPGMFREAARRSRLDPRDLVMVGDSREHDVEPALAEGWSVIWIRPSDPGASDQPRASRVNGGERERGSVQVGRFSEVLERIRGF